MPKPTWPAPQRARAQRHWATPEQTVEWDGYRAGDRALDAAVRPRRLGERGRGQGLGGGRPRVLPRGARGLLIAVRRTGRLHSRNLRQGRWHRRTVRRLGGLRRRGLL